MTLLTVKKTWVSVTSEINSEKEYEIIKLSDTEEDKLSKDQKNKMSIYSDSEGEKSSLYKKYSEKLWKTYYDNVLTTLVINLIIFKYEECIEIMRR